MGGAPGVSTECGRTYCRTYCSSAVLRQCFRWHYCSWHYLVRHRRFPLSYSARCVLLRIGNAPSRGRLHTRCSGEQLHRLGKVHYSLLLLSP